MTGRPFGCKLAVPLLSLVAVFICVLSAFLPNICPLKTPPVQKTEISLVNLEISLKGTNLFSDYHLGLKLYYFCLVFITTENISEVK